MLLGCDKSDPAGVSKDADASAGSIARGSHALREHSPDASAELRNSLETAATIESPEAREKALAEIAWNAIEIDPKLACAAFLQLRTGSPERIRLIQHYAMRLAEQDHDEALAWANELGTEQERAAANCQIALAIAETDPLRAANMVSESGIEGRDFDVAVVQVIQRWAARSPVDAGAWVSSFPPGAAREAGIQIIAAQWLPRDAPTAFAWLDSIKDHKLRQETAQAMEGIILQQSEEIRKAWLEHADPRIQNELEQQRPKALETVGDNIPKTQSPN